MALTTSSSKPAKKKKTGSDIKKLKLLITIVPRKKTEFFVDFIGGFEVNFQSVLLGEGTARSETLHMLGLEDSEKGVIISVIREDKSEEILRGLDEKFHSVKRAKGIAFTIPLTSVIGVTLYRFLSNNKSIVSEDKTNGK
ncbi:MAG: hypothetical protein IJX88_01915 [Clostridia bacterium]|nr:hypothetical protein [Clostridia bacterium]